MFWEINKLQFFRWMAFRLSILFLALCSSALPALTIDEVKALLAQYDIIAMEAAEMASLLVKPNPMHKIIPGTKTLEELVEEEREIVKKLTEVASTAKGKAQIQNGRVSGQLNVGPDGTIHPSTSAKYPPPSVSAKRLSKLGVESCGANIPNRSKPQPSKGGWWPFGSASAKAPPKPRGWRGTANAVSGISLGYGAAAQAGEIANAYQQGVKNNAEAGNSLPRIRTIFEMGFNAGVSVTAPLVDPVGSANATVEAIIEKAKSDLEDAGKANINNVSPFFKPHGHFGPGGLFIPDA